MQSYATPGYYAFAGIYALLFAPLAFLMLYASDAKLLLLLALLFVAARSPMHSAYSPDHPVDKMQRERMDEPDANGTGLLAS